MISGTAPRAGLVQPLLSESESNVLWRTSDGGDESEHAAAILLGRNISASGPPGAYEPGLNQFETLALWSSNSPESALLPEPVSMWPISSSRAFPAAMATDKVREEGHVLECEETEELGFLLALESVFDQASMKPLGVSIRFCVCKEIRSGSGSGAPKSVYGYRFNGSSEKLLKSVYGFRFSSCLLQSKPLHKQEMQNITQWIKVHAPLRRGVWWEKDENLSTFIWNLRKEILL